MPMTPEEYAEAMKRADAAVAEVEAELGIPPEPKPQEVRLERRITERREAEAAERQARLDAIRRETMVPLNDEGDYLYADVLSTPATREDLMEHLGPTGGSDLFGEDDMLDTKHQRGGVWPE
jgi:hypothetical protein